VEAVEARSYEKGGAINPVGDGKWGLIIFQALKKGKVEA